MILLKIISCLRPLFFSLCVSRWARLSERKREGTSADSMHVSNLTEKSIIRYYSEDQLLGRIIKFSRPLVNRNKHAT